MKTTELKIGDIVGYKDANIPVTVQAVLKYQVVCINEDTSVFAEDLTPIPLTEEILKKNTSVKVAWGEDFSYEIRTTNKESLSFFSYDNGRWVVEFGDVEIATIRYVHELQHILWALDMDDNITI